MDDIVMKLTAVEYLGGRLQVLGQELQGLGYQLSSIHRDLVVHSSGRRMTAIEFSNIAGTAARLHAQIERTLQETKQLMFAAESIAPKDSR